MANFERHQGGEHTILISIDVQILEDLDHDEFYLLAQSAGAKIFDHVIVQRQRPDPKYFIGSGKAEEIAEIIQEHEIQLAIFDHSLSPAQERNLEKIFKCRVIDRTGLILDIFAQRARTHEGKLQVELAQLQHIASRLVRGWGDLEQQKGGIGLRGPGESQLETDRRLIRIRLTQLKDKLEKVRRTRLQGRAARKKAAIPTISLVGYTNAGKSTLFNTLAHSEVYAADQLFATLDPTLRRVDWSGLGTVILADTVGFIKNLQHSLIDSFRATLEETVEATLLLHVIDASSSDMHAQIEAVEKVLTEIGIQSPILRIYNKIDASGDRSQIIYNESGLADRVYISAHTGEGLELAQQAVYAILLGQTQSFTLYLAAKHGKLLHQLHQLQVIQSEDYDEQGVLILNIKITAPQLEQLIHQNHLDMQEILRDQAILFQRPLEEFEVDTSRSLDIEYSQDSAHDSKN